MDENDNIKQNIFRFQKHLWFLNKKNMIDDIYFFDNSVQLLLNSNTESFYFLWSTSAINPSSVDNLFKILEYKYIKINLNAKIDKNINIKLYIQIFNDTEKVFSKSYVLENGFNDIEIEVLENFKYGRVLFRIENLTKRQSVVNLENLVLNYIESSKKPLYTDKHKTDLLVLTTRYPKDDDYYRNHFIHSRVRKYAQKNNSISVFSLFSEKSKLEYYTFEDIQVTIGSSNDLDRLLKFYSYRYILVHFFSAKMWKVLKKYIDNTQVIVWVHGAEIQPWYRRAFNYKNSNELEKAKLISEKKIQFWKNIFSNIHPNLHFIFVSQYFADEIMHDMNIHLDKSKYSIIHNYINTDIFSYHPKDITQRLKILSIRPYASRTYANDLSVKAVLYLKEKYNDIFSKLEFRFIGNGVLFDEILKPLRGFDNIKIEKRFLKQTDIAQLHKQYGVFLVPTRMDSQGVSRDEAMASGLVPITNNITAIPEFVDQNCAILAQEEDYIELAEGIVQLYLSPELFLKMSQNAFLRVRMQSSYYKTIHKELSLFK